MLLVAVVGLQVSILVFTLRAGREEPRIDRERDTASSLADEREPDTTPTTPTPSFRSAAPATRNVSAASRRTWGRAPLPAGSLFEHVLSELDLMDWTWDINRGLESLAASPALDMRETPGSYEIVLSWPDLEPRNLKVRLEDRLLTIEAEGSRGSRDSRERVSQFLSHRVQLPGPVGDPADARAAFTNGHLRVVVPKGRTGEGGRAGALLWP